MKKYSSCPKVINTKLLKISIALKGEEKECHSLFRMSNEISQIFVVMKGQISNCVCRK